MTINLKKWKRFPLLTDERTIGEALFVKNGTELDFWLRVNGKVVWYSVHRQDLIDFLNSDEKERVLNAASDGNAEEEDK